MMQYSGESKKSNVQATFDSIAKNYDLVDSLMSFGLDKGWRKRAVSTAEAKPGMKMLDVCCGTGQLSLELASAVGPSGHVTGLDFSANMLGIARDTIKKSDRSSIIELYQGDAMNLPFENDRFDGATVGWGLRNLPDLEKGIKEMVRVIKPGGHVVSLDMGKPTLPGFKQLYWFYFERLVPVMGKVWAGKAKAYQYFYESACEFPSQQELCRIFERCGLVDAQYVNCAGGVVAIVSGRKPGF